MSRPKKGQKGCEEASARWRKTMEAKFGGPEGVHKKMQEMGHKGGTAWTDKLKGFAANPELASKIAKIMGRKTKKGLTWVKDVDKEHGEYIDKHTGETLYLPYGRITK